MMTHNEGTEREIAIRLVVMHNGTPHYYDDYDSFEDMGAAASEMTAEAMIASAVDGIERVVGFAIIPKNRKESNGDRRPVMGNLGPHHQN